MKRALSIVLSLIMLMSCSMMVTATDLNSDSQTNRTSANVENVENFISSRGGRLATNSEMQEISNEVSKICDLQTSISVNKSEPNIIRSLQNKITETETALNNLPVISATYQDLIDLGFISATNIKPVPPCPRDTEFVDFLISTTTRYYNGIRHFHTRIFAKNNFSSSHLVAAPLYDHKQIILFDDSDNVSSLVAGGAKALLSKAIDYSSVSIPFFGPSELLGTAFEPSQTERLELNSEHSLTFVFDYVASDSNPTYHEMLTSENLSLDYYYHYVKLNNSGNLESETSSSKNTHKCTRYFNHGNDAELHAIALFDEDPYNHEYDGYKKTKISIKAKVGNSTKTFSHTLNYSYYRTLSSIPGA